jgi:hypothetical protein
MCSTLDRNTALLRYGYRRTTSGLRCHGRRSLNENRKQAVSIRLGSGDIRKVKRLAKRLGVRDSDVIRFAIKWTLNRIAPLCDPEIRGPNLVPMFVEAGAELIQHFELDAFRLEAIINEGVDGDRVVDHDDVALLALAGSQQPYALLRLRPTGTSMRSGASTGSVEALRQHLYDKYVYARADLAGRDDKLPGESASGIASIVTLVAG